MKDCLDYFNYIAQVLVVLCTAYFFFTSSKTKRRLKCHVTYLAVSNCLYIFRRFYFFKVIDPLFLSTMRL